MVTRTGTSRPLHRIKAFWTTLEAGMHRLIAVGMIEALAISLFVSLLVPWYKSLGYDSTTQGWLRFVLQITSAVVAAAGGIPVSYTHLDVYKRQIQPFCRHTLLHTCCGAGKARSTPKHRQSRFAELNTHHMPVSMHS